MSLQTHYERDEAKSAVVVAARWRQIYLEVQNNMTCCQGTTTSNYVQFTIMNNSTRNLLQQLYLTYIAASLDVQVAYIGVPDKFDSDPGDAGAEINQRDRALCIACKSWVDEVCNQGMAWIEGAVLDALPIATGALAVGLIPMPVTIFVGLTVLFVGAEVHTELNNTDYRSYLACGMYDALKDTVTTSATSFEECFNDLPTRPPPPESEAQDVARDIIETWLRSVVNDLQNYLAFVSTLNAAMSVASVNLSEPCFCDTWQENFLLTEGQKELVIVPYDAGCTATYNAIDDRIEGCCFDSPQGTYRARVELEFFTTNITRVEMKTTITDVRSSSGDRFGIYDGEALTGDKLVEVQPQAFGTLDLDTGVIDINSEKLSFDLVLAVNNSGCPDPEAELFITEIIVYGTGINPFT